MIDLVDRRAFDPVVVAEVEASIERLRLDALLWHYWPNGDWPKDADPGPDGPDPEKP